jgi:hypothetical protein
MFIVSFTRNPKSTRTRQVVSVITLVDIPREIIHVVGVVDCEQESCQYIGGTEKNLEDAICYLEKLRRYLPLSSRNSSTAAFTFLQNQKSFAYNPYFELHSSPQQSPDGNRNISQ